MEMGIWDCDGRGVRIDLDTLIANRIRYFITDTRSTAHAMP